MIKIEAPKKYFDELDKIVDKIAAGRTMQVNGAFLQASSEKELFRLLENILPELKGRVYSYDKKNRTVNIDESGEREAEHVD